MMNKIFAYGSLVLLALVGAGCGSGTTVTEMSFCAQKAEKECGTATSGVAVSCGATVAACKTQRVAVCTAWIATQESATRPFRPENVGACLSKTADAYASPLVVPSKRAAMDEACARVFSGKGAAKSPCTNTFDCGTADLICDLNLCVKMTPTTSGFCNDPGAVCPTNQYCMLVGTLKSCMPNKMAGQVCGPADPCVDGLRCSGGVCTEKVAVNGACGSDDDCAATAPYCDSYNACKCRSGFTPTIGVNECGAFGATDVTGTAQICPAAAGGAGGAAGSAGGAGGAGGAG